MFNFRKKGDKYIRQMYNFDRTNDLVGYCNLISSFPKWFLLRLLNLHLLSYVAVTVYGKDYRTSEFYKKYERKANDYLNYGKGWRLVEQLEGLLQQKQIVRYYLRLINSLSPKKDEFKLLMNLISEMPDFKELPYEVEGNMIVDGPKVYMQYARLMGIDVVETFIENLKLEIGKRDND